MKTVYIVRHAKSEWGNPDIQDFDRSLNSRGLRDAPFMAEKLKELIHKNGLTVQKIIASSALRAKTTAGFFAEELGFKPSDIQLEDEIYSDGQRTILKLLSNLDDEISSVMVVGHNPDLSSLCRYLIGDSIHHLVTCSVVAIHFDMDDWTRIKDQNGELLFHEFPRKYFKDATDD